MGFDLERELTALLQGIRPRGGFGAELLVALRGDAPLLWEPDETIRPQRSRWVVAGSVAGVVTATGAIYVAARRHHNGAA